jgi:hypothetical protein
MSQTETPTGDQSKYVHKVFFTYVIAIEMDLT